MTAHDPAPAVMLTIGIPVYDDFDGLYFTLQSLRLSLRDADWIAYVVIDNNPTSPQGVASRMLCEQTDTTYLPYTDKIGTAAAKNQVFEHANSEWVMCVDSHVLISAASLRALHAGRHELDRARLYHGVLVHDDMASYVTEMEARWLGGMYGVWGKKRRLVDLPVVDEIPIDMHGMGLFLVHRDAWPGFNTEFVGFGGEEGYIHEKVRRRGGDVACLTGLHWTHRFARPGGVPYSNSLVDRLGNYFYGFLEIERDDLIVDCVDHFRREFGTVQTAMMLLEVQGRMGERFPEALVTA